MYFNPIFPNDNIFQKYSTISPPGYQQLYNSPFLFRFPHIYLYMCVLLCNLITLCIHHHSWDTEKSPSIALWPTCFCFSDCRSYKLSLANLCIHLSVFPIFILCIWVLHSELVNWIRCVQYPEMLKLLLKEKII